MGKYSKEIISEKFRRREESLLRTNAGQKRHELLFEPYGVTPLEYRVLAFLLYHSEGVEPSVIADSLSILRQTATKVIDSLEKKGFITRTIHPTDRRRLYIILLPEGNCVSEQLLELETEYNLNVEAHFTPEEIQTYRRLFQKMMDARDSELQIILERRKSTE